MARSGSDQVTYQTDVVCGTPNTDEAERFNTSRDNWKWHGFIGRQLAQVHGISNGPDFIPPVGTNNQLVVGEQNILEIPFRLPSLQPSGSTTTDKIAFQIQFTLNDIFDGAVPVRGRIEARLFIQGNTNIVLYSAHEDGDADLYTGTSNEDQEFSFNASGTQDFTLERTVSDIVQLPASMQPPAGQVYNAWIQLRYFDYLQGGSSGSLYNIPTGVDYLGIKYFYMEHYHEV